jgi:hypothetical protein
MKGKLHTSITSGCPAAHRVRYEVDLKDSIVDELGGDFREEKKNQRLVNCEFCNRKTFARTN